MLLWILYGMRLVFWLTYIGKNLASFFLSPKGMPTTACLFHSLSR
jgi:hypothetical protein